METIQEQGLVAIEEIRKKVIEIIGKDSEDINPTFLILLFIINFPLIRELTKEEFYDKFCQIYDVIKDNEILNGIFDLKSTN